jgi:hypothetical protein
LRAGNSETASDNPNALIELEQKYGFQYPTLYKQAYFNGMLEYKNDYTNPTLFYGGFDIELIPFDSPNKNFSPCVVRTEIESLLDPDDYRRTPNTFKFIPFAATGDGDLYVFQYDIAGGADVPITLLPYDCQMAQILAKNLQDYIFRPLIEEAVYVSEDYSGIIDITQRDSILRTHKPYMKERHFEILSEIYCREIIEHDYIYPEGRIKKQPGLLSNIELKELFQNEIPYSRFDEEFKYMG